MLVDGACSFGVFADSFMLATHNVFFTIPENFNYEGLFDDVFQQHARSWELERVKTTNMGTLLELTYQVEMKEPRMPKEFIDQLRARNGNLNIILGNPSEKEML